VIRRNLDLALAAVVAAAGAVIVVRLSLPLAVRIAFVLPLVLVLPGYALVRALLSGKELERSHRLLLSLGLSLSLAIVTGLLLDVSTIGLDARSWAVSLATETWILCVVAGLRWRHRDDVDEAAPSARSWRLRGRDVLLFAVAACIFSGAVAFARTPLPAPNVHGYTALWLLPGPAGHRSDFRIGVKSGERGRVRYRLVVRVGTRVVLERRFQLEPSAVHHESVRVDKAARHGRSIWALLYREDKPRALFRSARILPPPAAQNP
jgi:uncharacterized membrane protein